jgi:pimeloyl-ACP methyl ester carboxylesterase
MKKIIKYLLFFIVFAIVLFSAVGIVNSSAIKKGTLEFTENWQGKFTKIDGESIRYIQKGRGQNILLIHGTPGSIEDWKPIIEQLSKNYKVTAFDRLGNGFSSANNYSYNINANVDLILKLIEKLKLKNVVVVGHSYGGSITTKMASLKNNNLKSFVVLAGPLYDFNADITYKLISTPIIGKGIVTLAAKTSAKKMIKNGLKVAFGSNSDMLTESFIDEHVQLWSQPKVLYTTASERRHYAANLKENISNYKNISKKITFLVGENDATHIVNDFNTMKKDLPNAEFIFLKNTAHYIQFEKTNTVIQVIKSHLKAH